MRSLAIGNPADGRYALELARASAGSIEAIADVETADAIRRTATLEGIFTETAGGVTIAAAEAARRRGVIRDGDEVVALLTGNGLKTPDAVRFGIDDATRRTGPAGAHAGHPGALLGVRRLAVGMSQVRIPPVLRTSAGGQKLIEVEGATVGEALSALVAAYPDLGPRLLDDAGRHQPVRERVRERDRRPAPPGARDAAPADATRSCCCRRWRAAERYRAEAASSAPAAAAGAATASTTPPSTRGTAPPAPRTSTAACR